MNVPQAGVPAILAVLTLIPLAACEPAEREELERAADTAAERMETAVETGAARAGEMAEAAGREAEQAIMDLEREWSRRFQEKDTVWIADLHARQGRMMPPNAEPVVGRDAVRSAWGEMARMEGATLDWESQEVHVAASGDMAYDLGTYTMTLPDGTEDRGKYVVVWVKEDGRWKVAVDMFSSNQPPPGGGAAPGGN